MSEPHRRHQRFTREEDELIRSLVHDPRAGRWAEIAPLMPNRTAHQVRERWTNYLKPTLNASPWTPEEEQMIQAMVGEIGQQWARMVPRFNNRTDVQIKAHYLLMQRRSAKIQRQDREDAGFRAISTPSHREESFKSPVN